jgi:integrase
MARPPRAKRTEAADGTVSVTGKAANGEGSIYFVASKGTYRAAWVDPATGKRRTVSASTKAEAARRMADARADAAGAAGAGPLGPDATIADVARWWLTNAAAGQVRPPTHHAYRKDVERIAADPLGSTPARTLDLEAAREFVARLRADGYAVGTIRNTRARLRQIADCAVDLSYIAANPVGRVKLPRQTAEERTARRTLEPAEVARLLAALDGNRPVDAAVALLVTNGLRASEALGLAWEDLDLDAATAQVRRASTYTGGGIGQRLDRPKTARTAGAVHLHPRTVELLRQRLATQQADRVAAGPDWQTVAYENRPLELVFTGEDGRPALRQKVYDALTDACERAGIDAAGIGTHAGRRSTVTNLFKAGVPLDDIARHVGHGSTTTTAGYVADLGTRPADVAQRAWELLDDEAGTHGG